MVRLVLDNPSQRNAMSDPMTASWVAAIDEIAADRSVRVVVVTGEGTAFCSGGNTGWIASEPDAEVDYLRTRMMAFYRAWLSIQKLEVPTVAAVNGPAIGAGLCLALACDIRYAAAGARLGAPFVKLGMNPGMGATYLLPNVVGEANARELLLTGRTVDAEEARQLGLVTRVFGDEEFACHGRRDRRGHRRHGTDPQPLHQARPARRRPPRPRVRGAVGGARPADHPGDGRPPGGHRGCPREAAGAVPGGVAEPGRQALPSEDPSMMRSRRGIRPCTRSDFSR